MAGRPKVRADLARLTCLTPEDADNIFNRIASGVAIYRVAESLSVSRTALSDWIEVSPDRRDRYKRARVQAASHLAEETIEIADGPVEQHQFEGTDLSSCARCKCSMDSQLHLGDVARDKLRIQSRQWLASRWDRTTYGDQKQTDVNINVNMLHLDALRRVPPPRPVCGACNVDPCRCQKRIE